MDGYSAKRRLRTVRPPSPTVSSKPRLPLSQAIARFSTFCDDRKVALVNRGICAIDRVPMKYQKIDTLYLSNNEVRDLGEIAQFERLQKVALSGNGVETLEQLTPLKQLKCLESLALDSNPVAEVPIYRDFVIDFLPSLKCLDSVAITETDRVNARISLQQYRKVTEYVVHNEEEIAKLLHIRDLAKMHYHMSQVGKLPSSFRSLQKLQKLMDLEWPASVVRQITDGLSLKAKDLLREHQGKDWVWAYTQCLLTQQHVMATLSTECEELDAMLQRNKAEFETPVKQVSLHSAKRPKGTKQTPAQPAVAKSVDFSLGTSLTTPKTTVKSTLQSPRTVFSTSKEDLSHQLLHQSPRSATGTPSARTSGPFPFPPRASSIKRTQVSLLPPDSDGATELRQAKMENKILRQQLQELSQYTELELMGSKRLADNYQSKAGELQDKLSAANKELEVYKGRLALATARNLDVVERDSDLPQFLRQKNEALIRHSLQIYHRNVRKRAVSAWVDYLNSQKVIQEKVDRIGEMRRENDRGQWLRAWLHALKVKRFMSHQESARAQHTAKVFFRKAEELSHYSYTYEKIRHKHGKILLRNSVKALASYSKAVKRERGKTKVAEKFAERQIAKRTLLAVYRYTASWHISEAEEASLTLKADSKRKAVLLPFAWEKWQEWRGRFGTKRRRMQVKAYTQYGGHLISLGFALLRSNLLRANTLRKEAEAIEERRSRCIALAWLDAGKRAVKTRAVNNYKAAMAEECRRHAVFTAFRGAIRTRIAEAQTLMKVNAIYRLKVLSKIVNGLSWLSAYQKALRNAEKHLSLRAELRKSRGYFFHWVSRLTRSVPRRQQIINNRSHDLLHSWAQYARKKSKLKYKTQLSSQFYAHRIGNRLKVVVWEWRRYCVKKRKLESLQMSFGKRKERTIAFGSFCAWRSAGAETAVAKSRESVASANYKLREALRLQSNLEELTEENTALESTVSTLRSQLADITAASDRQKESLRALEKQLSEHSSLSLSLEQTITTLQARIDSERESYIREIEKLKKMVSDLQGECTHRGEEVMKVRQESDQLSHKFALLDQAAKAEVAHLSSTISGLKSALESKEKTLQDAERLCEVLASELQRIDTAREEDSQYGLQRLEHAVESVESPRIVEEEEESEQRLEELQRQQAEIRRELEARIRRVASPLSDGDRGYR